MSDISELFDRCVAMHKAGEHAVAAQGYAAILRADPNHADAWHLSGLLAHQAGRSSDAVDYLNRAIELNSSNSEYFSNLAAIQMTRGHWPSALEAANQAVQVAPNSGVAWFQKGRAHAKLGQPDAAMEALLAARDRQFNPAVVLEEIGMVRQAVGDLTGSVLAIEESLQHKSVQPSLWLALSRMVSTRQYSFSEAQLAQMNRALAGNLSDKDKSRTSFALAAHFDSIGDHEAAFSHIQSGNKFTELHLHGRGITYDPAVRTKRIDDLIEVFSEGFINSLEPVTQSQRPIVVVGMPRSGTSLIEQVLASHPDVAAGGEMPYWTQAIDRRLGRSDLPQKISLITTEWRKATAEEYTAALSQISPEAARVVDKLPDNSLFVGFIATAFPNATIVHCCRDPRDTCLSCYSQLFDEDQLQLATGNLHSLSQRYQDYDRLMQHWHKVLPGRIVDVRYEQMVENPETQVRRLLNHCQLPWFDGCLNFHQRGNDKRNTAVRTASVVQVRQPMYKTSRSRWMRYESELQPLTESLKDCIARYEASLNTDDASQSNGS